MKRKKENVLKSSNKKVLKAGKHFVYNTNMTGEQDYVLIDSGFSGFAVIGSNTLYRNKENLGKVKRLNPSRSSYTFEAFN